MRIFLAKTVPPGDAWKEVMWGVIISFIAHLIGYILFEMLRRVTYLSYNEAMHYASGSCMIIALLFFLILRFPLRAAVGIAVGTGLIVMGTHQPDFWIAVLAWVVGIASTVRGFSEGPRPN